MYFPLRITLAALLGVSSLAFAQTGIPHWATHGRTSDHRGQSPAPTQPLERVLWSKPVDFMPQYTGSGALLIHYGTPLITQNNVILFPVKTGATDTFVVDGRNALTGAGIFRMKTDYSLATGTSWLPSMGPALTHDGRLYVPAAGGTVYLRNDPEHFNTPYYRIVFYGGSNFYNNRQLYSDNVKINTPIVTDNRGNAYFGYRTYGATPINLVSGIAKVSTGGGAQYRNVIQITGDPDAARIQTQCAPAVTPDGKLIYFAIQRNSGGGYLVALNTFSLATVYIRRLYDPATGNDAIISGQSTASPTIGPDGDVYFGILSNPHSQHNGRGYMLHFDKTLVTAKLPGSFGWDSTASLIHASGVPSYTGTSPYLLVTKYNNYAGFGTGDGINRAALLDPFVSQADPISGIPVMKEIYTIAGPTPDPNHNATYPGAVWEWCINSAAVDAATNSALINSEDGFVYRWDLSTNTLTQSVKMDKALGQAYTPVVTGPTGITYAINNAKLFAIGQNLP